MPRIPTYQPNQIGPVETTDARLRPADSGAGEILSRAVQGVGQALGDFAVTQDHINALNDDTQARKAAIDFAGKASALKVGFTALQGANAREQQAATEKQLSDLRDTALGSAANPRMRRFMEERIGTFYTEAASGIAGHAIQQAQVERAGAFSGEAAMYSDQAASESDPFKRQGYIDKAVSATNGLLDLKGIADPQARALAIRQTTSAIHLDVMDRALSAAEPDVQYVQTYLAAHHDEMTSDDVGKVERALQQPLQARQADTDVIRATGGIPQVSGTPQPVGSDVVHITGSSESGNRDFAEGGRPVTSPKGAMYRMQVMPATARDPGHGIKPAADTSPAEYNRVGEQLITALMRKYGDPAKAWAAYNWGEGRVDKAVAERGAGWLSAAPAETRAYVAKNVAQVDAQGHAINTPREWDKDKAYQQIDTLAQKEGWTFERTERAKRRMDVIIERDEQLQSRKQHAADEQAISIVTQMGDGFTSINQIPREVRESLSPEALARYTQAAESNSQPKEAKPNGPDAMALNQMRILEPEKFRTLNLGQFVGKVSPAEMDTFLTEKAKLNAQGANVWNPSSGITSALTYGRNISGLKFKPEEEAAVVQIMDAEARALHAAGKSDEQIDYNGLFRHATRNVATVHSGWLGGEGAKPVYQMGVGEIPDAWKAAKVAEFRQKLGRPPTDDELVRSFRATYRFRGAP